MRQLLCYHACHSGFYTLATRCHTCAAFTLKYTEASSLTVLQHSLTEVDLAFYTFCLKWDSGEEIRGCFWTFCLASENVQAILSSSRLLFSSFLRFCELLSQHTNTLYYSQWHPSANKLQTDIKYTWHVTDWY